MNWILSNLVRSSSIPALVADLSGRVVSWNLAASRLLGWQWPPADDKKLDSSMVRILPQLETSSRKGKTQLTITTHERREIPASAKCLHSLNGNPEGWLLMLGESPLPESRPAARKAPRSFDPNRAELERLQLAMEVAGLAQWDVDLQTGTMCESDNTGPIFGRPSGYQHASLEDWLNEVHPHDRERVRQELTQIVSGTDRIDLEYRILDPHGEVRWIAPKARVVRDAEGCPIRLIGVAADITDKRRAEEALEHAQERLNLVVASVGLGMWYCDLPSMKWTWSLKTKEHFWFQPNDEVTNARLYERIHREDRERTRQAIERVLHAGGSFDIAYRTVAPDGRTKWIRSIGLTFSDDRGILRRFDGVTLDITGYRMSEDALRMNEKLAATGRLAATLAHEINNPLAAVMNLLYLLEQDQSLSPLAWEYVHTAGEELRRVGHITKNILAFNRSNEQPEPVRVTALLDDVLELFGPRIRQAGITVQKEYRSEVPIQAYPSEIRQLLANFVENSLEALSPNSSKIRVRVARGREYGNSGRQGIRIVFADDGCGISPAHRKRIFDPFYTTKGERGTGLGLWVSNDVVTRHRGSIRLHSSDEPGQSYTCFRIYLPANEEPADESS